MSAAPVRSPTLRPHRMKKDESFLGKLGGTLARKKKAKEGESARAARRDERAPGRRDSLQLPVPSRPVPPRGARALCTGSACGSERNGASPACLSPAEPQEALAAPWVVVGSGGGGCREVLVLLGGCREVPAAGPRRTPVWGGRS